MKLMAGVQMWQISRGCERDDGMIKSQQTQRRSVHSALEGVTTTSVTTTTGRRRGVRVQPVAQCVQPRSRQARQYSVQRDEADGDGSQRDVAKRREEKAERAAD